MQPDMKEAFSTNEAAEIAGVGRTTLYSAIRNGDLPARKVGARTIILKSDLEEWLSNLPKAKLGVRQ